MPSTQQFRRRIKSVRSTAQITKAMEMVSASKMRRATEATLASRPYTERLDSILARLLGDPEHPLNHPLLMERPVRKVMAIVISSDRGLAGPYNASVARYVLEFQKTQAELGREVSYISMGRKVEALISRLGLNLTQSYPHVSAHPTTGDIAPLIQVATKSFEKGTYDEVQVIYTYFHSMIRQEVQTLRLLPYLPNPTAVKLGHEFLIEPSPELVINRLVPRLIEVGLYQALQEALASEHSARRMAMKNATDNAASMIDDLVLTYNSLRQGAITQEIAEITGGAAALT